MALPLIRALVRPSVDARRLGPLLFRSSRFLGALVLPQCAFYSALKGYPVPAPTSTPGASAASAAEVPVEIRVRKADKVQALGHSHRWASAWPAWPTAFLHLLASESFGFGTSASLCKPSSQTMELEMEVQVRNTVTGSYDDLHWKQ